MQDLDKLHILDQLEDAVWSHYTGKLELSSAHVNVDLDCIERCQRIRKLIQEAAKA